MQLDPAGVFTIRYHASGEFKSLFLCPSSQIQYWQHCLKFFAVDGAFSKAKSQGCVLSACTLEMRSSAQEADAGRVICLAAAITDGETAQNPNGMPPRSRD